MIENQLYLPTVLPQYGIFAGIALVIIAFVDKKERWAYAGWGVLVATGLAALYFNLFGGFAPAKGESVEESTMMLITAGWLTATGGVLALATLLFLWFKLKRYTVLAVLTLAFFAVIFFQYNSLIRGGGKSKAENTEQTR